MGKQYINYLLTILASLLFFPLAFLGQIGGNLAGEFFVWFNNYFSYFGIPKIISIVVVAFMAGYIAGYFSAYIIKKVYKNLNLICAMIFPILLIGAAMIGDFLYAQKNGFDLDYLGHVIRNPATIFYYYYFLFDL